MTVEVDIFNALKGLASNRVYPDVAPESAARPYITYQQIGGQAANFLESAAVGKRNARFQINCWADTRAAAAALSRQVEDALVINTALRASIIGAPTSLYEDSPKKYGTRQDFSVWFTT